MKKLIFNTNSVKKVWFNKSMDGFKMLIMNDKYSLLKTSRYNETYEEIIMLYQQTTLF